MTDAERIAEGFAAAFLTIRPLQAGTSGQRNYWHADVPGWGISAPTVRELVQMLRDWFWEPNPPTATARRG